ncbi:YlbD family protein [Thalassobacillus pellis]|uniref:YlbD family protein n=1 Tax=Thalassobacillus pellis TaxID=748008 RepID=UPI00196108BA|nr:YlbD family protein [Thalassobacillus pellis]MBM7552880.1 hypothetical protein [Thalassobacillus pellis]
MEGKSLHPNVEQFREFVNRHPKVKHELRNNKKVMQDYYEKWLLLGEEDPFWESFSETKTEKSAEKDTGKKEWMSQFVQMVDQVNWNNINGHIHQLNGALGNLQNLVQQFQEMKQKSQGPKSNSFPFIKD